jgi:hypothetical protein
MKTNWTPGLSVMLVGLTSALIYVFLSRKATRAAAQEKNSDDLEARYQSRLNELKNHHENKHLLPPAEWEAEKSRLELAAARVLKDKQSKAHDDLKREARLEKKATEKPFLPPMFTGILIGAGVVGGFTFMIQQLPSLNSVPEMPAEGQRPPMKPVDDTKMKNMLAKVEANPSDADAASDLALYLLKRQGFGEAAQLGATVASLDAFHVRGRVVREVLKAVNGDVAPAINELERLADLYPEAVGARFFSGMLAIETDDKPRALQQFELYLADAPPGEAPPMMRMAVQQLRNEVSAGVPPRPEP